MAAPKSSPATWEAFIGGADAKKTAPHCERNKGPILEKIQPYIESSQGTCNVLEVACGTGQHAAFMASSLGANKVRWTPTDMDSNCLLSTHEWTKDLANVEQPCLFDVTRPDDAPFEAQSFGALYCCNCIHIAPPAVTDGLVNAAGRFVRPGGHAFIYGPFRVNGELAESNSRFDATLRQRDPSWGIRDIEDLDEKFRAFGFSSVAREELPANNLLCVWRKDQL